MFGWNVTFLNFLLQQWSCYSCFKLHVAFISTLILWIGVKLQSGFLRRCLFTLLIWLQVFHSHPLKLEIYVPEILRAYNIINFSQVIKSKQYHTIFVVKRGIFLWTKSQIDAKTILMLLYDRLFEVFKKLLSVTDTNRGFVWNLGANFLSRALCHWCRNWLL